MKGEPGTLENMNEHNCGNCAHWEDEKPFGVYSMDFCCREDSGHYNYLMNRDSYCKAWEGKEDETVYER